MGTMHDRLGLLLAAALLVGCGAGETDPQLATAEQAHGPRGASTTRSEPTTPEAVAHDTADDDAEPEPDPTPTPPPEPAPVEVEAGVRLGAIRIGMSEDEVRALGLEESEVDPRSRRFGPYVVSFRGGTVARVESTMGRLGRIRFGTQTFPSGTHIFVLRDAFGDCVWQEGGGERYECAGGSLFVHTTHSLAADRYTIGVAAR